MKKTSLINRLRSSIQSSLVMVMAGMMLIVLIVNMFVFRQSRTMVKAIDSVFVSNSTIVQLTDDLSQVETSLYDYLSTRGSSSLEDFYRYEQDVRDITDSFNDRNTGNRTLMLEKNIREMSESYLRTAEAAIQAKRGRNVEQYRRYYSESKKIYDYINTAIYALNSRRFAQNNRNYQTLQDAMGVLEASGMIMILATFVMTILLAVMLIREIFGPLKELTAAADRVADGDFGVQLRESDRSDEIGVVNHAFRKMLFSIRDYIERQRISMEKESRMKENELSMRAHLKEAQLNFLQAQINPHFLFNSLNAGSQLAALEGADRTQDFLGRMADFFRYNVQKTGGDATLAEELQLVDNYIYILNVRFAGDIHFEKMIDPDISTETVRMPSMILQPIVENAVQHGIHDDHEHGRIWLYVEKADRSDIEELLTGEKKEGEAAREGRDKDPDRKAVMVTVSDNGAGMTKEQIRKLLDSAEKGDDPKAKRSRLDTEGVAMGNVISRLFLYYGREGLFRIFSQGPGEGTEVTVCLPLEEGEENG